MQVFATHMGHGKLEERNIAYIPLFQFAQNHHFIIDYFIFI